MPRPAPRGMPEMPEITPWVPIVPKFPDLPDEIPWPPDFDWGDGLSPWYSGNDGRPYCYNDFASRLMRLIIALAAYRASIGLRPMYPPFDLRFMVATPTIVNIATLWLATMWNTATIGGGTPDPSWTALYDWTTSKTVSAKAIVDAVDTSAISLHPYQYRTQYSAFEGHTGSAVVTFSGDAWTRNRAGVSMYAWRYAGRAWRQAWIDIGRGSMFFEGARFGLTSSTGSVALTGDSHTIGYSIGADGTVTYTVDGAVVWSGTGKVVARDYTQRVCSVFAVANMAAYPEYVVGQYAKAEASFAFAKTDNPNQPSVYDNYLAFDETAYNYGDTAAYQSGAAYSEHVHYIDGDGNPVESSSPTPPIMPLSLSSLDCGQMNGWLRNVEGIVWPILRA